MKSDSQVSRHPRFRPSTGRMAFGGVSGNSAVPTSPSGTSWFGVWVASVITVRLAFGNTGRVTLVNWRVSCRPGLVREFLMRMAVPSGVLRRVGTVRGIIGALRRYSGGTSSCSPMWIGFTFCTKPVQASTARAGLLWVCLGTIACCRTGGDDHPTRTFRMVALPALAVLALAIGPAAQAPEPYDVVLHAGDVTVPMRDGVRLATDVYRPARRGVPAATRFPVLLQRTPYGKEARGLVERARCFVRHGYVVVRRDGRLRYRRVDRRAPVHDRRRRHVRHLLRGPHAG